MQHAELQGANLFSAQLGGVNLALAQLQGADLSYAQAPAAVLSGAQMQGAILSGADLTVSDLRGAQLQGAKLKNAMLLGADLSSAQLQGSDLRQAKLWGSTFGRMEPESGPDIWPETDLGLADLREVDFGSRLSGRDEADLRAAIYGIPSDALREKAANRLDQLFSSTQWTLLPFRADLNRPVVVTKITDPIFGIVNNKWLVSKPDTIKLVELLVDTLAKDDSSVAGGIAARAFSGLSESSDDRELSIIVACRLITGIGADNVKFDPQIKSWMLAKLRQMKVDCKHILRTN